MLDIFTAKKISSEMPSNLFLNWNSVPSLDQLTSPSSPKRLYHRTQNGKVDHCPPPMVVESMDHPQESYSWPYVLKSSSGQRAAKCIARMRIQEKQVVSDQVKRQKGKETKPKAKKPKRQRRRTIAFVEKGKPSSDDIKWFDGIEKRPSSLSPARSLSTKITLKELTIPVLQKVPPRVRKKLLNGREASTSSDSGSSVDSDCRRSHSMFPLMNNIHSKSHV